MNSPPLTATQRIIYEGLSRDPNEFGQSTEGLSMEALGVWGWLMCVVRAEAGRRCPVRWPFMPTGEQRAAALDAARQALIDYYCPGRSWWA